MTRRSTPPRLAGAGLVLLLGAGCAAPTSTVQLRLMRDGAPVAGAHVRGIPLGVSPAPLPVTLENLAASAMASGDSGVTDRSGRVRLDLDRARDARIEVSARLLGAAEPDGPYVWLLSREARGLVRAARAERDGVSSPYKLEMEP